jgi:hypothetical protein
MNPIAPLMFDAVVKATVQEIATQIFTPAPKPIEPAKNLEPQITALPTRQIPERKAA